MRLVCLPILLMKSVRLIGIEPAGHGIESGEHGTPLGHARVGIYFGMKSPLMRN